jgi:hypothetical protein
MKGESVTRKKDPGEGVTKFIYVNRDKVGFLDFEMDGIKAVAIQGKAVVGEVARADHRLRIAL